MGKTFLKILILCVLPVLLFTGCGHAHKGANEGTSLPSTALQPFESSAQFTYDDFSFDAVVKRNALGSCVITITSPKAIEGMTFTYQGDQLTVEYLGLSVDIDPNTALSQAAVSAVVKALDAMTRQNGIHVSFEDSKFLVNGETENGDFTLILDEKSGNFLSLEIPEIPMSVTFHNFQFLSAS